VSSFRTARLSAEPVSKTHLSFFLALWSDERVASTLEGARGAEQVERALQEAVEHWETWGFGRWLLRRDRMPVGTVKLAHCCVLGRVEVELGYALLPDAWGHGYATEAGAGALSYGRDVVGIRDVVAFALFHNAASFAVMERLGFVPEAQFELPAGRHRLYRKVLLSPTEVA
jgi:RimJ/RimL family protein N-acetyltransferase